MRVRSKAPLNQREYCALHALPLKRFGNWRDRFKAKDEVRQAGLLHRRGGLSHMSSHLSDKENTPVSTRYIPSGQSLPVSPMPGSAMSFIPWPKAIAPARSMTLCRGTGKSRPPKIPDIRATSKRLRSRPLHAQRRARLPTSYPCWDGPIPVILWPALSPHYTYRDLRRGGSRAGEPQRKPACERRDRR
jgi:hypothetical protein